MSVLCLNVGRLCLPNIMSLGVCFKKIAPRQIWHLFSVKIRVIFGVQFERLKVNRE